MKIVITGRPKGYVARTFRGKHTGRAKAYHEWLEVVKYEAIAVGWKWPKATADDPIRVDVQAYYRDHRGPDPENVRKAVVDALFPSGQGGDKYVYGAVGPWRLDKDHPRVEVVVSTEGTDKRERSA